MKKKLLATLLLSGLALSYIAVPIALADEAEEGAGEEVVEDGSEEAVEEGSGKTAAAATQADVTFTAGDRPDPAQPEEGPAAPKPVDPDLDPETNEPAARPEANNVYVTHLPNISFGSNKTALKTVEYKAVTEKRTKNDKAETFYMPHSVQVADLSGNNATKWKLSVHQDKAFKTSDSNAHELTNTRIRIYGNTLTNTGHTTTELQDKVAGVALDKSETADAAEHYSEIPVASAQQDDLVVLENKTAGFTLNSYTSAVFENGYLQENYFTPESKKDTAERYGGVRLNVPANDQVQAKKYTTSLTWTLTVEP